MLPHAGSNCDGRFGAAESAGRRCILSTRECEKNAHKCTEAHPLSRLSEKQPPTHQDKWLREASLLCTASYLLQHFQHFITVSSSYHSIFMSFSASLFPPPLVKFSQYKPYKNILSCFLFHSNQLSSVKHEVIGFGNYLLFFFFYLTSQILQVKEGSNI